MKRDIILAKRLAKQLVDEGASPVEIIDWTEAAFGASRELQSVVYKEIESYRYQPVGYTF